MIPRLLPQLALAAALLGATACSTPGRYAVEVVTHHEVLPNTLDGRWFTRTIYDGQVQPAAVELVYCPILPGQPVTCRTAVVWERDHSELLTPRTVGGRR